MERTTIQGKKYFIDHEVSDGEEVSALYSSNDEFLQLDKGIFSNGWVTMINNNLRVKYDRDRFAKLTPVPVDYEYQTSEGEELFIAIIKDHDEYGYARASTRVIKAKDVVEANVQLQKIIMEEYFDEEDGIGQMSIAKAEILQISGYLILDLEHISGEWNKTIKEKYENEQRENEKAEYEKLRKKFEEPKKQT